MCYEIEEHLCNLHGMCKIMIRIYSVFRIDFLDQISKLFFINFLRSNTHEEFYCNLQELFIATVK